MAGGGRVLEQELLGEVEDQQAAHAVVGKPLPHLGEEQDHQAARMLAQNLQQHGNAGRQGDEDPDDHDDAVHGKVAPRRLDGLVIETNM